MRKVYVVGAKRSPIGAFMGSLSDVHPADFGSQVLSALITRNKSRPIDYR